MYEKEPLKQLSKNGHIIAAIYGPCETSSKKECLVRHKQHGIDVMTVVEDLDAANALYSQYTAELSTEL